MKQRLTTDDESLYDWYINDNLRTTCPKCGSKQVKDIDYAGDKDGYGVIYRCQSCFYRYGIEDESGLGYYDKNGNPTIYWK